MKFFLLFLTISGAYGNILDVGFESRSGKIVGGEEATQGEFPYQVSIQKWLPGNQWSHFCGGSIWNKNHILTAAHCELEVAPAMIRAVIGAHNLEKNNGVEQIMKIYSFIVHPQYDNDTMLNDIALLKLQNEIDLSVTSAAGARIPYEKQVTATGTSCTATGWYLMETEEEEEDLLQKVDVPVVSDEECKKLNDDLNPAGQICAGAGADVDEDGCLVDGGSPLYCSGYQAGVVSDGCGTTNSPWIYTEVQHYVKWLTETAGNPLNQESAPHSSNGEVTLNANVFMLLPIICINMM